MNNQNDNIDLNDLLIQVLDTNSSFGFDLRKKIINTLDVVTQRIEKSSEQIKFSSEPITIADISGIDEKEKQNLAIKFKTRQNRILKHINEIARASNYKNIKKGVNLTDILGSDKTKNEQLQRKFENIQRQIIGLLQKNIPTKINLIPNIEALNDSILMATNNINDTFNKDINLSIKQTDNLSKDDTTQNRFNDILNNNKQETIDNTGNKDNELYSSQDNNLLFDIIDLLKESSQLNYDTDKNINDNTTKNEGEAFIEKDSIDVNIVSINNDIFEKLGFMSGKIDNETGTKSANTEGMTKIMKIFDTISKYTNALKIVGVVTFIGLMKYFNKNPEAFKKLKQTIPKILHGILSFFKKLPDYVSDYVITPFINFGKSIGEGAYMISEWVYNNVITPFINFGKSIGEGAYMISEYFTNNVITPFINFGKSIGEGAYMISEYFTNNVINPIKDTTSNIYDKIVNMGKRISKVFMSIPDFISTILEKAKNAVLSRLNKIPGITIGKEAKIEELKEKIAKENEKIDKSNKGENVYVGSENKGIEKSKNKIKGFEEELIKLNSTTIDSGMANDFIYRPGQPIQKFSSSDVLIGSKEKIIIENKDLDLRLQELNKTMNAINNKFNNLIDINNKMLVKSHKVKTEQLPPIPKSISSSSSLAHDDAYNFRLRAWEILHGV